MTFSELIAGDPIKLEIQSGRHRIVIENCGPSDWLETLNGVNGPWFRLSVDHQQVMFTNDPQTLRKTFREVCRFASVAPDAYELV